MKLISVWSASISGLFFRECHTVGTLKHFHRWLWCKSPRTFVSLLLVAGVTSSCSSFKQPTSGADLRKEGYEVLLKTVKPGMYRRQLYAVLPPYKTPMAMPPAIFLVSGTGSGVHPMFTPHQEVHELDEECTVTVQYQLKNGAEYHRRRVILDQNGLQARPARWDGLKPDEILKSLSGLSPFRESEMPSRENSDDIIVSVSGLQTTSDSAGKHYKQLLESPTQKAGAVFGRTRTPDAEVDYPFPMNTAPR